MEMNRQSGDSSVLEASLNRVLFSGRSQYERMMHHLNLAREVLEAPKKIEEIRKQLQISDDQIEKRKLQLLIE
jgi:hypothetical protein